MNFSKRLVCFLAFTGALISCADILTVNIKSFSLINHIFLVCLTLYLVDLRKVPKDIFLISLASLILMSFCAIKNYFDFSIFLKYLLILYVFFISSIKRKFISKEILNSLIFYPYITLLIIGIIQTIILTFFRSSLLYDDLAYQGRAIGLALEPTFYSQQILIFAILSDCLNLKKFQNPLLNKLTYLILIFILIESRTRTSMIGGLLFLLFNINKINKFLIYIYISALPLLIIKFEGFFNNFFYKFINLFSIKGEPREQALIYMVDKITNVPILGYGLYSEIDLSGLTVGSLYANFPIALIYSLGFGALPFLVLGVNLIFSSITSCKKLPIFVVCIFALPMPFLYTPFGLMSLFMATYKTKYLD